MQQSFKGSELQYKTQKQKPRVNTYFIFIILKILKYKLHKARLKIHLILPSRNLIELTLNKIN